MLLRKRRIEKTMIEATHMTTETSTQANADGSVTLRAYSALMGWVKVDISGDNAPLLHSWLHTNMAALTLAIAPDIEADTEAVH